jgi:hypothetical protein
MPLSLEEQDLTTDDALLESLTPKQVEELKLEPFSLMRQTVALDLNDRFSGPFWRAVMTVWICTLKPRDALRAHADMDQAKLDAFEWAEKRGYNHHNWKAIIDPYNKLMDEWEASANNVRIQQPNGSKDPEAIPNAGGQPA